MSSRYDCFLWFIFTNGFSKDGLSYKKMGENMGLENTRGKKLLYHLTKVDNMESIIKNGLLPRRRVKQNNLSFVDVADSQIIEKRNEHGLDSYTPFHFHPYSAFDVAVKNTHPNDKFVYICIKRALAEFNDFKIMPMHPLSSDEVVLYEYAEGMNKIDWDAMERVGTNDEYSKNVKMAECLTKKRIPADLFQCMYVPDEETKEYIEELLRENGITEQPPYVDVQEKWFQIGG